MQKNQPLVTRAGGLCKLCSLARARTFNLLIKSQLLSSCSEVGRV